MFLGERHVGQYIGLRLIQQGCQLGEFGPHLIGHGSPLPAGSLGGFPREGGGDEGGDDAPAALAGMGQRIAHEVHVAALPGGTQQLGLPPPSEMTSFTPRRPRRISLRRKAVQKDSASEGPMSMPSTSRRPSLLTPTAMITATETIRSFWRTLT